MVRMFVLMKFLKSSKMGCVWSKSRSLGQILEKACVHSKGHIFHLIIMKLGQSVFLDKIANEFQNKSCQVKN